MAWNENINNWVGVEYGTLSASIVASSEIEPPVAMSVINNYRLRLDILLEVSMDVMTWQNNKSRMDTLQADIDASRIKEDTLPTASATISKLTIENYYLESKTLLKQMEYDVTV